MNRLGLPDEEIMSCEDGLVENHEYRDLRGLDWKDVHTAYEAEETLLSRMAEFEDPYDDELWDDDTVELSILCFGCDPGVASTVGAISAIGACPVTSCSGGAHHYEEHPLVFCWCTAEQGALIRAAAQTVDGVEVARISGGLLVYTMGGVSAMRDFALTLEKHWNQ